MAENYFDDNKDLLFQLSQVDFSELVPLVEGLAKDDDAITDVDEAVVFYKDMLSALGNYISEQIAPHSEELDAQHPVLKDGEVTDPERMAALTKGLMEMGAMAMTLPRKLGGMNAPRIIAGVLYEMLARADVSVMSHFGFHGGIAQALSLYSMEEGSATVEDGKVVATRFEDQITAMGSGGEWGAMVLTEPGAGSDLALIRSKAALGDDGKWRVTGQKIFITSGHGEHHIVIARTESEETHPGLKGLSLFYVPRHVEKDGKRVCNFEISGIEHKMGQHSAVAATLNYEDSEAELIGTRGHGFRGMLLLMNNARIAVGHEGVGIIEHAHRMAKAFAEERVTMGKPIAQHEMIAEYLDDMELQIAGLRAITLTAAFHEEMATRIRTSIKLNPPSDEDERKALEKKGRYHKRKSRALTPLIKYTAGEEAVKAARMNMQIFGGPGYITETGAERLLRDALILPVYEGTSQIQALMALKDNMQIVMRNPGHFFSEMAATKLDVVRARDPLDRALARLVGLKHTALQTVLTRIAADKLGDVTGKPITEWRSAFFSNWDPSSDFSFGLLHAERLTKILSLTAIAQVLVKQAHDVAKTDDGDWRREIAERWLERAEPKARGVLGEIEAGDGMLGRLLRRRKDDK